MSVTPSGTELMRTLPPAVVDELVARSVERRFRDGERIHARGDGSHAFLGIRSGAVRVSSLGPGGREMVVCVLTQGMWFGEIGLLDGGLRTHHADAQGATVLLTLSRSAFEQYAAEHPELYHWISILLCQRLRLAFSLLDDVTLLPLRARTARRLLGLMADQGAAVRISQQELACMSNGSREHVGRILNCWKHDGLISIGYGRIEVADAERLGQEALL